MACPFFEPSTRIQADWGPGRYPLGSPHTGVCQSHSSGPVNPRSSILRKCCNFGYARGQCPDFPGEAAPDAVRFGIAADGDGIIRLHFVTERDHHPFDYSLLEYERSSGDFLTPIPNRIGRRQALSYIQDYLRAKPGV